MGIGITGPHDEVQLEQQQPEGRPPTSTVHRNCRTDDGSDDLQRNRCVSATTLAEHCLFTWQWKNRHVKIGIDVWGGCGGFGVWQRTMRMQIQSAKRRAIFFHSGVCLVVTSLGPKRARSSSTCAATGYLEAL